MTIKYSVKGVRMKILVADDTKTTLMFLCASLEDLGHEVIAVDKGEDVITHFKKNRPDLIFLDVVMKGMNGFECAKQVRAIDDQDWIPIIFLSASVDDKSISLGIDAGGDDYLAKPFSQITLAAKIKAMQRIADMRKKLLDLTNRLSVLSSTDSLTHLYNRYQFQKTLQEKIAESNRNKEKMALLFLDIDKFKPVNDQFGHSIGDLLLIEIAKRLRKILRANDFIARIGGDEFAIIFSKIDSKEMVSNIAKKIIESLSHEFIIEDNPIHIGISIGIVIYPTKIDSYEDLIRYADTAMYKVKKSGRNNFLYYDENLS